MIRLIFSDMDGTLLDENGRLPEEFGDLYLRLRERGIIFAPASGRQYASLRRTFAPWQEEMIFVAENGTMVVDRGGRELFASPVDRALALSVLQTGAENPAAYSVLCGKKHGYVLRKEAVPSFCTHLNQFVTKAEVVESFAGVDDEPIKMSFCDLTGNAETTILPQMLAYEGRLQVSLSSREWVDLYNCGVSKGAAARHIQEALGIAPEECAAFGDYENDLELMDAVTHSFAMENALPSVKARARYTAPSNSAHGVTVICERILAGDYD